MREISTLYADNAPILSLFMLVSLTVVISKSQKGGVNETL